MISSNGRGTLKENANNRVAGLRFPHRSGFVTFLIGRQKQRIAAVRLTLILDSYPSK
jgi:hypothetical protein